MSKLWIPSCWSGNYKLAPSIAERVSVYLRGFKNRDSSFKLAVWLSRMNASPKRIDRNFPLDRRALAQRPDLGLTEAQLRGAISSLLKIGFVEVVKPKHESRYRKVGKGVKRLPIQYVFSFEFLKIFRYIVTRLSSPKGRQDSKLLKDSTREAPFLGDLSRAQGGLRLYKAPAAFKKPLKALGPWEEGNSLHDALRRLGSFMGARRGKGTPDGTAA